MAEYIKREDVIQNIVKAQESLETNIDKEWTKNKPYFKGLAWANRIVLDTLDADVIEVKYGKWLPHDMEQNVDSYVNVYYNIMTYKPINYRCNLCGRIEEFKEPYCNCGAKMDID